MFYEYDYEENEKYIDTEELLSIPRPIINNTLSDTYEYEDDKQKDSIDSQHHKLSKSGTGHHKISISEDSDSYLFENTIESNDEINIDDFEKSADTTDDYGEALDTNIVDEEYKTIETKINSTDKGESLLIEKIKALQENFRDPYYSKHDSYRYKQISEMRQLYDSKFSDFEEFVDFISDHDDMIDAELLVFYNTIFRLPNPEQFYTYFRSDLFSESPQANGKGYMINQLKRKMLSL